MTAIYDVLVATKWGFFLLRTILKFWNRRAVRNIESSEKLLDIKETEMDFKDAKDIPVVVFRIAVESKVYLKLQRLSRNCFWH